MKKSRSILLLLPVIAFLSCTKEERKQTAKDPEIPEVPPGNLALYCAAAEPAAGREAFYCYRLEAVRGEGLSGPAVLEISREAGSGELYVNGAIVPPPENGSPTPILLKESGNRIEYLPAAGGHHRISLKIVCGNMERTGFIRISDLFELSHTEVELSRPRILKVSVPGREDQSGIEWHVTDNKTLSSRGAYRGTCRIEGLRNGEAYLIAKWNGNKRACKIKSVDFVDIEGVKIELNGKEVVIAPSRTNTDIVFEPSETVTLVFKELIPANTAVTTLRSSYLFAFTELLNEPGYITSDIVPSGDYWEVLYGKKAKFKIKEGDTEDVLSLSFLDDKGMRYKDFDYWFSNFPN